MNSVIALNLHEYLYLNTFYIHTKFTELPWLIYILSRDSLGKYLYLPFVVSNAMSHMFLLSWNPC